MKLNKGFTLVELLIVMVIVGLLVTIALPQYKVAMEKGRALEALHDAQALSDTVNAEYVKNYNTYPASLDLSTYAGTDLNRSSKMFKLTVKRNSSSKVTVTASRQNGPSYFIVFENTNGEVSNKKCGGSAKYCKAFGLTYVTNALTEFAGEKEFTGNVGVKL